jgi:hypothetical protein
MHSAQSSEVAHWIVPRLHHFAMDVCSFVPDGFDSYARILHPPLKHTPDGKTVPVRWRDIAAAHARSVEEELLLLDTSSDPSEFAPSGEPLWNEQSHVGTPSRDIVDRLVEILSRHTHTPNQCVFAIWEGWGPLADQFAGAPRFSIPGREMLLLVGSLEDATTTLSTPNWSFRGANLWWPNDRAWCVSTEIDFKWTYVGGSAECIYEILKDPYLEAYPVTPTTIR